MVMSKEAIIDALKDLPDEADVNDAIDYLIYLAGIEEGLADDEAGRLISHEGLLERIKSWRGQRGQTGPSAIFAPFMSSSLRTTHRLQ